MSRIATKRLQKELSDLQTKGCPTGCRVIQAENLEEWILALRVLGETVYEGEEFALRFRFSTQYPIDSPEVTFLNDGNFKPPIHPHVYTNGHICASVLGSGWSPVLNVQSLLLTMQSMLASCKKVRRTHLTTGYGGADGTETCFVDGPLRKKELPPDNDRYVRNAPKSPKDTRWAYHDDTV